MILLTAVEGKFYIHDANYNTSSLKIVLVLDVAAGSSCFAKLAAGTKKTLWPLRHMLHIGLKRKLLVILYA